MAFLGVDNFPLIFKEPIEDVLIPPCLKLKANSHVIFGVKEYILINNTLKSQSPISFNISEKVKIDCS